MFNGVIGLIDGEEARGIAEYHPEENHRKGYIEQQRDLNERVNEVCGEERKQARKNALLQLVIPHNVLCCFCEEAHKEYKEKHKSEYTGAHENCKVSVVQIGHKRSELTCIALGELHAVFEHIKTVVIDIAFSYSHGGTAQKQLSALLPQRQSTGVEIFVLVVEGDGFGLAFIGIYGDRRGDRLV